MVAVVPPKVGPEYYSIACGVSAQWHGRAENDRTINHKESCQSVQKLQYNSCKVTGQEVRYFREIISLKTSEFLVHLVCKLTSLIHYSFVKYSPVKSFHWQASSSPPVAHSQLTDGKR